MFRPLPVKPTPDEDPALLVTESRVVKRPVCFDYVTPRSILAKLVFERLGVNRRDLRAGFQTLVARQVDRGHHVVGVKLLREFKCAGRFRITAVLLQFVSPGDQRAGVERAQQCRIAVGFGHHVEFGDRLLHQRGRLPRRRRGYHPPDPPPPIPPPPPPKPFPFSPPPPRQNPR